jgi:putative transcriptional regulator
MSKNPKMRKKIDKRMKVGETLVRRLERFTKALETTAKLPDRFTCRTVRLNLQPRGYKGSDVKKARKILGVSQALFAQFAGVSVAAVRDWEQDVNPPTGSVCRLMDEIIHNPMYFRTRIRELATPIGAH